MSTQSQRKSAHHLRRLITTRNDDVPNFALLFGSGASKSSGVGTAADMIEGWRRLMFDAYGDGNFLCWVKKQSWYDHDDEYSTLFETIYDQPAQRRVLVEELVKKGRPNWGYVYLTGLLYHHFFDVVFTTNFDDLINEACYLYSDVLRPIVAAHDSAVQGIRVTAGRAKIIKLHGDFLYDDIKNTLAELETLETNIKRKLHQFAQEYGLVVVGYSGRDRSVMDTLNMLLRDEDNYKQGIYWCLLPGEEPCNRLRALARRDRVYLVEISGFDEFFADLYKESKIQLPEAIARPYALARRRVDLFVSANGKLDSHPVISEHKTNLLKSIADDAPAMPLPLQASFAESIRDLDVAIQLWKKATEADPDDTHIATRYANLLANKGKAQELRDFLEQSPLDGDDRTYNLLLAGLNEEVVSLAKTLLDPAHGLVSGIPIGEESIVRINRAIALKRLGHKDGMRTDLDYLEENGYTAAQADIRAGVAALRGDKVGMFAALEECLFKSFGPRQLMTFPVFEDLREDQEFQEFVDKSLDAEFDRQRRRRYPLSTQEE